MAIAFVQGNKGGNNAKTRNGQATPPAPFSAVANGQTADPAAAPVDRTASGQFARGNRAAAGRGNAFSRKLGSLRAAFVSAAASEEQVAQVGRKLLELALAGDVPAATLYLGYALGKPGKVIDIDRLDLDELALLEAQPTVAGFAATMGNLSARATVEALAGNIYGKSAEDVLNGVQRSLASSMKSTGGTEIATELRDERKMRQRRRARV
jgi:hypothetical protein